MSDILQEKKTNFEISSVIVNWNTKELLLGCINSIKKYTHSVIHEIIVVDNNSTDGSQEAVRNLHPDVILIQNNKNLGFAKANNIGINLCSGKYIAIVNSDVEIKDGCLDKMKIYMDRHPEIGMLGPKIFYPDATVQLSCKQFPSLWRNFCEALSLKSILPTLKVVAGEHTHFLNYNKTQPVDCLIGAFWLVRRESIESVGLLDENFYFYSEDIDWCRRFWNNNWKVIYYPKAEITHYSGSSSKKVPIKYYIQQQRARLQYCQKYHGSIYTVIDRMIILLHQIVRIVGQTLIYITVPSRKQESFYKIKRSISCLRWLIDYSSFKFLS